MKKQHFDVNKLPPYGKIIFPLSMSRLSGSFSPEKIYEFLEYFEGKVTSKTCDVFFLYTNDLYFNTEEKAIDVRKRVTQQMTNHKIAFESLVAKKNRFIPAAFHYLPWDYAILNSVTFNAARARLISHLNSDPWFRTALLIDLNQAKKEPTEANLNFLIEEHTLSHLLMEKDTSLPYHLADKNGWRLFCYPGDPPFGLVYLWKKNLLRNRSDLPKAEQIFAQSLYNMEKRLLIDFSLIDIEEELKKWEHMNMTQTISEELQSILF